MLGLELTLQSLFTSWLNAWLLARVMKRGVVESFVKSFHAYRVVKCAFFEVLLKLPSSTSRRIIHTEIHNFEMQSLIFTAISTLRFFNGVWLVFPIIHFNSTTLRPVQSSCDAFTEKKESLSSSVEFLFSFRYKNSAPGISEKELCLPLKCGFFPL